jgi:hypothetical protein
VKGIGNSTIGQLLIVVCCTFGRFVEKTLIIQQAEVKDSLSAFVQRFLGKGIATKRCRPTFIHDQYNNGGHNPLLVFWLLCQIFFCNFVQLGFEGSIKFAAVVWLPHVRGIGDPDTNFPQMSWAVYIIQEQQSATTVVTVNQQKQNTVFFFSFKCTCFIYCRQHFCEELTCYTCIRRGTYKTWDSSTKVSTFGTSN